MRSLLFVPGDSERKQAKALASDADALILDLEDSVAAEQRPAARERVRELLQAHPNRTRQQLWVRVNPLSGGSILDDLVPIVAAGPDGIVLPKVDSPAELVTVDHYLTALEAREGRTPGSIRILVIATETPRALLNLGGYAGAPMPRLAGLTWGAEDLSAALGAGKTEADGSLTLTFQLARSLCVVAAAAAGVQAIDGVYVSFRDLQGLRQEADRARRDGFTGKLAIHPDQVPVINEAFTPTAEEVEHAKRIVDAFAAAPGAGVLSLDGQMIDRPHLVQAQRLLEAAAWAARRTDGRT